jgi:hypothetical protein
MCSTAGKRFYTAAGIMMLLESSGKSSAAHKSYYAYWSLMSTLSRMRNNSKSYDTEDTSRYMSSYNPQAYKVTCQAVLLWAYNQSEEHTEINSMFTYSQQHSIAFLSFALLSFPSSSHLSSFYFLLTILFFPALLCLYFFVSGPLIFRPLVVFQWNI